MKEMPGSIEGAYLCTPPLHLKRGEEKMSACSFNSNSWEDRCEEIEDTAPLAQPLTWKKNTISLSFPQTLFRKSSERNRNHHPFRVETSACFYKRDDFVETQATVNRAEEKQAWCTQSTDHHCASELGRQSWTSWLCILMTNFLNSIHFIRIPKTFFLHRTCHVGLIHVYLHSAQWHLFTAMTILIDLKKKKKEKNLFGCKMYDNAVKSTLCVTKVGLCDGVRPSETSVSK